MIELKVNEQINTNLKKAYDKNLKNLKEISAIVRIPVLINDL